MSLADQPDNLIAHLTTYLSYSDVCSLMESSKKTYNAIKGYKKDKLKTEKISIEMQDGQLTYRIFEAKVSNYKTYYFKNINNFQKPLDALRAMLNECASKVILYMNNWQTDRGVWIFLNEMKDKISHISFENGKVELNDDDLILLCQTFKDSEFDEVHFNNALWTDKVLAEIVPYTSVIRRESRGVIKSGASQITDRTLKSLIWENSLQGKFAIANVCNSFTIQQILSLLKVIETREIAFIDWNLGLLNKKENADADRYFSDYEGNIGCFEYRKYEKAARTSYKLTLDLNFYDMQDYDDDEARLDEESVVYFSVSKR